MKITWIYNLSFRRIVWAEPKAQLWFNISFNRSFVNDRKESIGTELPYNWILA